MNTTPRRTSLVRTPDLRAFGATLVTLASEGDPLDARDRLLIVPTRAAAALLTRRLEAAIANEASESHRGRRAVVLPDVITPRELTARFAARLPFERPTLNAAEREVLLGVACRSVLASGVEPPFQIRPRILAEMLRFYDELADNLCEIGTFERLTLGRLEPGAGMDRGAERLVRQTRFLAAAFRAFEALLVEAGDDERRLRARTLAQRAERPIRHAIVAVGDAAFDRLGLCAADWDLLSRVPLLERLDVVITDGVLAGAPHERMHTLLPGIEEVRAPIDASPAPALVGPAGGTRVHVARDREEEVAGFVRYVKRAARSGLALEKAALVVAQPLPYTYVSREVFRSAGVPCHIAESLPLAAEPYAAAVSVVCAAVTTGFARDQAVALLRCAHLDLLSPGSGPGAEEEGDRPAAMLEDVAALQRALTESGYLGDLDALERLLESWREQPADTPLGHARRAGMVLASAARELAPLRVPAPRAEHLSALIAFLVRHAAVPLNAVPGGARRRRSRAAVLGVLHTLRDACARFDATPVDFETPAALVRRWIEGQTFAPRDTAGGVLVIDAESARFGDFEVVQLAGLVDGEWPDRPHRNIFYGPDVLRDLGWPSEADRRDAARARFAELLRAPAQQVMVSTFALEADVPVAPSTLLDDLEGCGLDLETQDPPATRIFEHEALALEPLALEHLPAGVQQWARLHRVRRRNSTVRRRGLTGPHRAERWSLTALERYQECPFRCFARHVLRLEDAPDDGASFSPRARGRFVHDVLQRFFEIWDATGRGPVTPARLDEARAAFREAAEPLLATLPDADAALERARLFGTAVSMGMMDVLLGVEAARPEPVQERWLERRLDVRVAVDGQEPPVVVRGIADRVDILRGRRLRVIDYKTGAPPNPKTALQVASYARSALEQLQARDGAAWTVHEAAYVRLGGPRPLIPVVPSGGERAHETLEGARTRLVAVLQGIGRSEFPPRPVDRAICDTCAFSTVCRKDYADGR